MKALIVIPSAGKAHAVIFQALQFIHTRVSCDVRCGICDDEIQDAGYKMHDHQTNRNPKEGWGI
jgi:hypothetical protein